VKPDGYVAILAVGAGSWPILLECILPMFKDANRARAVALFEADMGQVYLSLSGSSRAWIDYALRSTLDRFELGLLLPSALVALPVPFITFLRSRIETNYPLPVWHPLTNLGDAALLSLIAGYLLAVRKSLGSVISDQWDENEVAPDVKAIEKSNNTKLIYDRIKYAILILALYPALEAICYAAHA